MNSFSVNRFGQLLGWLINMNRVRLLGFTAGIMFSTFLIQLMLFVFGSSEKVVDYLWSCVDFGSFFIPFLVLFLLSMTYTSFTSVGKNQQRGTFLMIPATNLEKFLSLIVYMTVICGLCTIVGYILGDCLRMACLWIWAQFSADPGAATGEVYNYNAVDGTYYLWSTSVYWVFGRLVPHFLTVWSSGIYWSWSEWATWILAILVTVWTHSIFTLGSTLLRKYTFAITGIVWFAILLLFMWFNYYFGISITTKVWINDHYKGEMVGSMAYVLMVALPLLSYFNYWASFRIFKGFQIITNKWTNYDILKR